MDKIILKKLSPSCCPSREQDKLMRKGTGHRMRQLRYSGAGDTARGTSKFKKTTCMALWPTSSLLGSDYRVP